MQKGVRFAWVKRRVSPAEADQVRAMKLAGVGFVKETRRYYPRRELAGQILGIVGDDGEGLEGVERAWDDSLQGEAMRLPSLRDARGAHLLAAGPAPERVLEGGRVELTIDQSLQNAAERALVQAVQQARAANGMLVAVDPATGEILALATAPLLNPNAPRKEDMRNRAVLDTFEVGSTAKAVVLSRALDEGAIGPETSLFCENGQMARGQAHHPRPQGAGLGPAGAGDGGELQHLRGQDRPAAGPGAAPAGLPGLRLRRADRDRDRRRAPRAGPLPEGGHRAREPELRAGPDRHPAPDHARHGRHRQPGRPHEAVARPARGRPGEGDVLSEAVPTPVRRVVSAETAAQVTRWLEGVVADADGTGKKARLAGWKVAGKTGTAQKADAATGGYSADKRFSSFVGFAPAEAPRIVIGVFIDEPKGEVYGGDVAAPVFREVVEHALKARGVPTEGSAVAALPPPPPAVAPAPADPASGTTLPPCRSPTRRPAGRSRAPWRCRPSRGSPPAPRSASSSPRTSPGTSGEAAGSPPRSPAPARW